MTSVRRSGKLVQPVDDSDHAAVDERSREPGLLSRIGADLHVEARLASDELLGDPFGHRAVARPGGRRQQYRHRILRCPVRQQVLDQFDGKNALAGARGAEDDHAPGRCLGERRMNVGKLLRCSTLRRYRSCAHHLPANWKRPGVVDPTQLVFLGPLLRERLGKACPRLLERDLSD